MKIGFLYPIEKNSLIMIKLHLFLFRGIAFDLLFPLKTAQKSLGDNRVGFIAKVCAASNKNPSKKLVKRGRHLENCFNNVASRGHFFVRNRLSGIREE